MKTAILTAFAMIAFAANSLLCRAALSEPLIDAYSFTALRVISGAIVLGLAVRWQSRGRPSAEPAGWRAPVALFAYALPFSLAYLALDTGTGALLLFGAVQTTMIVGGIMRGNHPTFRQWVGLACAVGGLVYLVFPGVTAPDPAAAGMMLLAGVSWGLYSLQGLGTGAPLVATSQNFARAVPLALIAGIIGVAAGSASPLGVGLAVTSGAVTSGVGYAVWYAALRNLDSTTAAVVQLSVPILAAGAGIALLHEQLTPRLVAASLAILGGIMVVVSKKTRAVTADGGAR